jgi:hypothetical protein
MSYITKPSQHRKTEHRSIVLTKQLEHARRLLYVRDGVASVALFFVRIFVKSAAKVSGAK